jgi:hypothetical protein
MEQQVTDNETRIQKGLSKIKKLRLFLSTLWLSFIPFVLIVSFLRQPDWIITFIGIAWVILFVVFGMIHAFVRCPACNKPFNFRGLYGNPFTSKCLHCGISLKDEGSEDIEK